MLYSFLSISQLKDIWLSVFSIIHKALVNIYAQVTFIPRCKHLRVRLLGHTVFIPWTSYDTTKLFMTVIAVFPGPSTMYMRFNFSMLANVWLYQSTIVQPLWWVNMGSFGWSTDNSNKVCGFLSLDIFHCLTFLLIIHRKVWATRPVDNGKWKMGCSLSRHKVASDWVVGHLHLGMQDLCEAVLLGPAGQPGPSSTHGHGVGEVTVLVRDHVIHSKG